VPRDANPRAGKPGVAFEHDALGLAVLDRFANPDSEESGVSEAGRTMVADGAGRARPATRFIRLRVHIGNSECGARQFQKDATALPPSWR
jgi:hypothetical protein